MGGGICKSGHKNKEEKQKREGREEQLEVSELDPARAEDVGQVTLIRWSLHSET